MKCVLCKEDNCLNASYIACRCGARYCISYNGGDVWSVNYPNYDLFIRPKDNCFTVECVECIYEDFGFNFANVVEVEVPKEEMSWDWCHKFIDKITKMQALI